MPQLLLDRYHRRAHRLARAIGEGVDVEHAHLPHHAPLDRVLGDDLARQRHVDRRILARPDQLQRHLGARLAAHFLDRVVQLAAIDRLAVDPGDVIARFDSRARRRRVLLRRDDLDQVAFLRDRQAQPPVIALGLDLQVLVVEPGLVGTVRIERGEHAVDRALDQHLVRHLVDIIRFDPVEDVHELIEFAVGLRVDLRHRAGADRDEGQRADDRGCLEQMTGHDAQLFKQDMVGAHVSAIFRRFLAAFAMPASPRPYHPSRGIMSTGRPRRRSSTVTRGASPLAARPIGRSLRDRIAAMHQHLRKAGDERCPAIAMIDDHDAPVVAERRRERDAPARRRAHRGAGRGREGQPAGAHAGIRNLAQTRSPAFPRPAPCRAHPLRASSPGRAASPISPGASGRARHGTGQCGQRAAGLRRVAQFLHPIDRIARRFAHRDRAVRLVQRIVGEDARALLVLRLKPRQRELLRIERGTAVDHALPRQCRARP